MCVRVLKVGVCVSVAENTDRHSLCVKYGIIETVDFHADNFPVEQHIFFNCYCILAGLHVTVSIDVFVSVQCVTRTCVFPSTSL